MPSGTAAYRWRLRLDDDVGILDNDRESLGDVWPLFHFGGKLLTTFDRNRKRADLEALRIEPGLTVAHGDLPAVPRTAQQLADARALVNARFRRGQPRHARRLVERRALMRAAIEKREELAIDVEHDNVAGVDVHHLVAAGGDFRCAGDDVTSH